VTDQPGTSFELVRADLAAASGVAIHGEVDLAGVPALERALEDAIGTTAGDLVVDLSGVEFMDSTGLLTLLNARGLLAREGRAMAVVCPAGPVRYLLEVAGVSRLLAVYDSPEQAEAALP
jgi:anti-anti-sigma factor